MYCTLLPSSPLLLRDDIAKSFCTIKFIQALTEGTTKETNDYLMENDTLISLLLIHFSSTSKQKHVALVMSIIQTSSIDYYQFAIVWKRCLIETEF